MSAAKASHFLKGLSVKAKTFSAFIVMAVLTGMAGLIGG